MGVGGIGVGVDVTVGVGQGPGQGCTVTDPSIMELMVAMAPDSFVTIAEARTMLEVPGAIALKTKRAS